MSEINKKPFEPEKDFVKVHRALYSLYTRLPDFKSDHALMYIVLMDYYNVNQGYAYPTKATLALRLNCGINKPNQLSKVLEKYGLVQCVERDKTKVGSNDIYYVYAPITCEQEFNEQFPGVAEHYAERERRLLGRNKRSNEESQEEQTEERNDDYEQFLNII